MTYLDFTAIRYSRDGAEHSFHSTVPALYLVGIGAVITNWSLFEMVFDNLLAIIRWNAAAKNIAENVPNSFRNRAKLLSRSASAAFPNCPTIQRRIDAITKEAIYLGRKRNNITHSHWFAIENEMIIWPSSDGSKERLKVTPDDIFHLAILIKELQDRVVFLQLSHLDESGDSLPFSERTLLRAHFEKNLPIHEDSKLRSKLPSPLPFFS